MGDVSQQWPGEVKRPWWSFAGWRKLPKGWLVAALFPVLLLPLAFGFFEYTDNAPYWGTPRMTAVITTVTDGLGTLHSGRSSCDESLYQTTVADGQPGMFYGCTGTWVKGQSLTVWREHNDPATLKTGLLSPTALVAITAGMFGFLALIQGFMVRWRIAGRGKMRRSVWGTQRWSPF